MAAKAGAKQEARTRIVFHLPINNAGEENAIHEVFGFLQDQRNRKAGVTGFPYSELLPAAFTRVLVE